MMNELSNQLAPLDPPCLKQPETWRKEVHRMVDCFYEKKRREFVDEISEKQIDEFDPLWTNFDKLLQENEDIQTQVDSLLESIRSIEERLNELEHVDRTLYPLMIDTSLIVL
jgi:hypothetical protein